MKRALKGLVLLGGAIVVLVVVCVMRAVALGAKASEPAVAAAMPVDANAVNRLAAAIRIPTVTEFGKPPNFVELRKMHALLETSFPRVRAALAREVLDSGTVLYTWRGKDTSLAPVLLMG